MRFKYDEGTAPWDEYVTDELLEDKKDRLKNNKKAYKEKLKIYKAHMKALSLLFSTSYFNKGALENLIGECTIVIENTKDEFKNIKLELKKLKK